MKQKVREPSMIKLRFGFQGHTAVTQGLLQLCALAVLGIQLGLATCKASVLNPVLCLWSPRTFILNNYNVLM